MSNNTNIEDDIGQNERIDLIYVIKKIRSSIRIFIISVAVSVLLAILYLNFASYTYTAQIKIIPVQSTSSGFGRQLGGIASIARMNLPPENSVAPFDLYMEELHSRTVADQLSNRQDLMLTIFGGEWDREHGQWRQPDSLIRPVSRFVKTLLGMPISAWHAPDGARLQQYIASTVIATEELKKATVTISFNHPDPKFAVAFLSALHQTADSIVRKRALEKATQYIDYLNVKITTVTVAEYRAALTNLLMEQEKTRMIASSSLPYAAELIDFPYASVGPTKPRGLLILIGAIFLGLAAGLTIVLGKLYLENRK